MIIVPELKAIVITPPRTGSTSLRTALLNRYQDAYSPHDHMEMIGAPAGFIDCYHQVVMVRHPVDRLYSMYQYMRTYESNNNPEWIDSVRKDSDRSFSDWLLSSKHLFVTNNIGRPNPRYGQLKSTPAVQKSAVSGYGDPTRGFTRTYLKLENVSKIEDTFDIKLPHFNVTNPDRGYTISADAASLVLDNYHLDDQALY